MFSSDFVKTFRLALKVNEWQMASVLGMSVEEFIRFEKCPLSAPGMHHGRFQMLLTEVAGVKGYVQFSECLKADILLNRKVVTMDQISRIQLVKASKAE